MHPTQLDHLALYVADRDGLSQLLLDRFDIHVVDRTERFTLLGPSGTDGKLTLFDAPAATTPEAGALVSVLLHEPDAAAHTRLETPHGVTIVTGRHGSVDADTPRHAFIGLTLRSTDPAAAARRYAREFGLDLHAATAERGEVGIGTGRIELVPGRWNTGAQGVLNHLGFLVDSADEHREEARLRGLDTDWVDAPNTLAVFIAGPDDVRVEYVQHKPEFALS